MHEILAPASWMAECPLAFCMPGLFSFHVLVAMTSFHSVDAAMSCSRKGESKQTPHNLGCHPAVIPHGSWGNVTLSVHEP